MRSDSDINYPDHMETLMKLKNNFRMSLMDEKPHIKEYHRVRDLHQDIVDSMVKYFQDGKFEQKAYAGFVPPLDPRSPNKRENSLIPVDLKFDLDTREGAQAFYDMVIYKPAPNMNCITEEYINNRRYRIPERVKFLHSMLASKRGLFIIEKTDAEEGYVYLKEVFTGDEYKIVDIGLSGNKNFKDIYMYTRIVTHYSTSFNTGLGFFFIKSDEFIEKYIWQHKRDRIPNGDFLMFTQLYSQYAKFPGKLKIVINRI